MIHMLSDRARAVSQRRMEKHEVSRCAKLIETHPHGLSAVIAAKGAVTETRPEREICAL